MAKDVTYTRGDYDAALPSWELVANVVAGEEAVKAKGEVYLPNPSAVEDDPGEKKAVYDRYKQRASFYNVTGHTLQGLIGAVFRKDPALEVVAGLDYVSMDVDGAGVSIFQQSQRVLENVMGKGREGLLVDYPNAEAPASRADQNAGLVRASIVRYQAERITNWRTTKVGGAHVLSMVVLHETVEEPGADGFSVDEIEQYRVLQLVESVYQVTIWRANEKGSAWEIYEQYTPKRGNGSAWDRIPFTFVGAQNNDSSIDKAPLLELATLNITHYQIQASWYNSLHYVGQGQPWMAGLNENWVEMLERNGGVIFGSRAPIMLPEGGSFGIAEMKSDKGLAQEPDKIEERMRSLGAKLMQVGSAIKTATEVNSDDAAQHSALSLASANVSEAYTKCLGWCAEFMGASGDVSYLLNQDLVEHTLDSQLLREIVAAWMSGAVPETDVWAWMRLTGLIDSEKTDDQVREEVSESSTGLALDDADGGT
jgi:hypothetical protein